MSGIHREFAEHSLETYPGARPVKQTTRRLSEPKRLAVGAEIDRLLKANFIREIKISTWLANPVLVPKKNTNILCMCIDYTSLNKDFPKDNFPITSDRSNHRLDSQMPAPLFPRRLLGLSADPDEEGG